MKRGTGGGSAVVSSRSVFFNVFVKPANDTDTGNMFWRTGLELKVIFTDLTNRKKKKKKFS